MTTVQCQKCKAPMVFLLTRNNRRIPIDASTVRAGDVMFDHTRHVSHFATCPAAAHFRKKKGEQQ